MEHKINIAFFENSIKNIPLSLHLRKCIRAALQVQNITVPCEINVLVTDDNGIREINCIQRQIDAPTDVLSFPMFEFTPDEFPENTDEYLDPETGYLPLGDMAISLERAKAQAEEFGHSVRREIGYLTVHSVLHLLGYDHVDEGPMKKQMRIREETILAEILLSR